MVQINIVTDENVCLTAKAMTEGEISIGVILDTGASTSLVGRGLIAKRQAKGLPPLETTRLARRFTILGVSSAFPIQCKGVVEIPARFEGDPSGTTIRFRALLVEGWEGDTILSRNVLDKMGVNFVRDRATGRTTHIHLSRVGDVVFPVVNKSDRVTAEVARGFAAEIEKAVLGDKEQDLKDRTGRNASPPSPSEDRRERSR